MKPRTLILTLVIALVIPSTVIFACTGITLRTKDGSIIFARTLEFTADLESALTIVPRGTPFVGSTPTGKPGLRWTTKYGIVGMNAFGQPLFADGLNERGLHVGLFYFPDYAQYQSVTEADYPRTLAPHELAGFLLGTCASVKEAVAAAQTVKVADVVFGELGFVPPVHYALTDAAGNSVVLEHIAGELKIHKNPLGVVTNSPTFDWHMTNLSNYVNLTVNNVPKIEVDGNTFRALGQGSGMLGLPGDFTPPSRFVRAAMFSATALPVSTAHDGVLQAFHLLNQFDIPKGAARGQENGQQVADYTLWTVAADLKNRRYYYRTFENSRIRMIDLNTLDMNVPGIRSLSIGGDEAVEDVSEKVK